MSGAMSAETILVVEDEDDLRAIIVYHLKREGYHVLDTASGEEAVQIIRRDRPAVVLLDLMLPGIDGLRVCTMLKSHLSLPELSIVMVSALATEDDVLRGLELGADDYIRKPFKPKEVVARVATVLRRRRPSIGDAAGEVLHHPPLSLNQARHEVLLAGIPITLTATEYRLLCALMSYPERVFDRMQLLRLISDQPVGAIGRNIDVHIRAIRRKLGDYAGMIDTSRGVGYRFLPSESKRSVAPAP